VSLSAIGQCESARSIHISLPSGASLILNLRWVLSHFTRVRLFATPWTITHQAPLSREFSRQKYWSELPCPPPGDLPYPGIEPTTPTSPALHTDSLPTEPPGKPNLFCPGQNKYVLFRQAGLLHTNNCLWNSTGHPGSMTDRKKKLHNLQILRIIPSWVEARSPWFQTSPNSSEGRNPTCWSWQEGSILKN